MCVPKMAQQEFPDGKLRVFARWSLWSGGGGVQGGLTPPPLMVYTHSNSPPPPDGRPCRALRDPHHTTCRWRRSRGFASPHKRGAWGCHRTTDPQRPKKGDPRDGAVGRCRCRLPPHVPWALGTSHPTNGHLAFAPALGGRARVGQRNGPRVGHSPRGPTPPPPPTPRSGGTCGGSSEPQPLVLVAVPPSDRPMPKRFGFPKPTQGAAFRSVLPVPPQDTGSTVGGGCGLSRGAATGGGDAHS